MKRIWITGGGSGIGAEMAKIYAEPNLNSVYELRKELD